MPGKSYGASSSKLLVCPLVTAVGLIEALTKADLGTFFDVLRPECSALITDVSAHGAARIAIFVAVRLPECNPLCCDPFHVRLWCRKLEREIVCVDVHPLSEVETMGATSLHPRVKLQGRAFLSDGAPSQLGQEDPSAFD